MTAFSWNQKNALTKIATNCNKVVFFNVIINRPSVARAVLQSPLWFINWFNRSWFMKILLSNLHSQTVTVPPPTFHVSGDICHVSCVTCHLSPVTCRMSRVTFFFFLFFLFLDKVVKLDCTISLQSKNFNRRWLRCLVGVSYCTCTFLGDFDQP